MEYLLHAKHISKHLTDATQLILIAALGGEHFYDPQIKGEETGHRVIKQLIKSQHIMREVRLIHRSQTCISKEDTVLLLCYGDAIIWRKKKNRMVHKRIIVKI